MSCGAVGRGIQDLFTGWAAAVAQCVKRLPVASVPYGMPAGVPAVPLAPCLLPGKAVKDDPSPGDPAPARET